MEMKEEIMGDAIDDAFEEDDEEEEGEALVNQVRAARGSERESAPPGWLSAWLCTPACLPVCLSVCLSVCQPGARLGQSLCQSPVQTAGHALQTGKPVSQSVCERISLSVSRTR
jgi:hypothetical protein